MFWGLVLEPGKRYSTTVEKSFHVSKAVLDCASVKTESEVLTVILETEGSESLLCNLCKQKGILQESLDLNFMQGDRLTFECRGLGRIHLSGYLLPDDDEFPMMEDEEEESEEEDESSAPTSPVKSKKEKRKSDQMLANPAKKSKIQAEDEDDDEEGESDDEDDDSDIDLSDLEGLDNEDDDEEEDEESSEESPKEKQKPQKKDKQNKAQNKQNQQNAKNTPVTNGVAKEQKSNKKMPGGDKSPNAMPKHKQVLEGGVIIKDIKVGTGAPAVKGKNVKVHYFGKLKDTGKVFDKNMKGDGFKFKLGKGEVIKGWEIGVQGMKVGGKRIIHCPPETAYGAKGAPPQIPGNSSLIFEVELKHVF